MSNMFGVIFVVVILTVLNKGSQALNVSQIRESMLRNYDSSVRPNSGRLQPPVEIGISAYLLNVDLDDDEQRMSFTLYFREHWKDSRLTFSEVDSPVSSLDMTNAKIWTPDTFFPNEVDSKFHDVTYFNSFTSIKYDGSVLLSRRYTIEIFCPMAFTYFPMDVQTCQWDIESYATTMKDIIYKWAKGAESVGVFQGSGPIGFKLWGHNQTSSQIVLKTGSYLRLSVVFKFVREPGYYIFHLYIPALIATVFAYVTLWLTKRASLARHSLSITALIIMTAILIGSRAVSPVVSYLTPLDIYLGLSFMLVLLMVIYHGFVTSSLQEEFGKTLEMSEGKLISPQLIEKLTRAGFGIGILVFNFLYWIIFTQLKETL